MIKNKEKNILDKKQNLKKQNQKKLFCVMYMII